MLKATANHFPSNVTPNADQSLKNSLLFPFKTVAISCAFIIDIANRLKSLKRNLFK